LRARANVVPQSDCNRVKYNKLVRDRIPEIIERSGKACTCETLPEGEFIKLLNAKLTEEINEYLENGTVEELADISEVINAILSCMNITPGEFQRIRLEKLKERGGFGKRLLLKEVIER
jgi:predicted house-cleaning noncanonical NTP pyrophosphatase (MazG superfamily)